MRQLAGHEVDDGHEVVEGTKAPGADDGRLDGGVDRLGGAVAQRITIAVADALEMGADGGAETFEGFKPGAARPTDPPLQGVLRVGAGTGLVQDLTQEE